MVKGLRLCLSLSSAPTGDVDRELQAASQAGFDCIELWVPALEAYLGRHPLVWLDLQVRQHKIRSLTLNGLTAPLLDYGEDALVGQAHFMELCAHVDALGGGTIVARPARGGAGDRDRSGEVIRALRAYADMAAPFEVMLAVEFEADSAVPDWQAAQAVVERAAKSNLRLSFSTHKWHESENKPQDLETLKSGQLALVHLDSPLPHGSAPGADSKPSSVGDEAALARTLCEHLAATGFRGPYCTPLSARPGTLLDRARAARQTASDFLAPFYEGQTPPLK
jgi:sugar phosphate isomerase/epimerase